MPNLNRSFKNKNLPNFSYFFKTFWYVWNTVFWAQKRGCFERNIQSRKSCTWMKEKFVKSFSLYNWKKEDHLGRFLRPTKKTLPFDEFCHAKGEIHLFFLNVLKFKHFYLIFFFKYWKKGLFKFRILYLSSINKWASVLQNTL